MIANDRCKITFILPLYHGYDYFKIWLKENYKKDLKYSYIFADGSGNNKNLKILNKINKIDNYQYIKFKKDLVFPKYLISKIKNTLDYVKTKYVMLVDVDDFINYFGVNEILYSLEKKQRTNSFCCGEINFISSSDNSKKYKLSGQRYLFSDYSNNKKQNIIKYLRYRNKKNISYVFYSIYEKKLLQKIYKKIETINIKSGQAYEMIQTIISFYYGNFSNSSLNHYLRLHNTKQSAHNLQFVLKRKINKNKIYFQQDLKKIKNYLINKFNISACYANLLCNLFNNQKTKKNSFIYKIVNKFLWNFDLNVATIIKIINFNYKLKKFLKLNKML